MHQPKPECEPDGGGLASKEADTRRWSPSFLTDCLLILGSASGGYGVGGEHAADSPVALDPWIARNGDLIAGWRDPKTRRVPTAGGADSILARASSADPFRGQPDRVPSPACGEVNGDPVIPTL